MYIANKIFEVYKLSGPKTNKTNLSIVTNRVI